MFQSRIAEFPKTQGPMPWMDFPEAGSTVESLQSWLTARMYGELQVSILPDGTPILSTGPWQFREKPESCVLIKAMRAVASISDRTPDGIHQWFLTHWDTFQKLQNL